MKAKWMILGAMTAGLLLATACGGGASSSPAPSSSSAPSSVSQAGSASSKEAASSSEAAALEGVYRGEITELGEGQITVAQMPGYNYGQPSIVFNTSEEALQPNSGQELSVGMFVEVKYNGVLTRSIPPQGTADSVVIVSPIAEGVIQNGVIQAVEKTDVGYRIEMLPLEETAASGLDALLVLNVPTDGLEGLTEADLVEGAKVSAVTMGIATASLPPQMPVKALLPYTG